MHADECEDSNCSMCYCNNVSGRLLTAEWLLPIQTASSWITRLIWLYIVEYCQTPWSRADSLITVREIKLWLGSLQTMQEPEQGFCLLSFPTLLFFSFFWSHRCKLKQTFAWILANVHKVRKLMAYGSRHTNTCAQDRRLKLWAKKGCAALMAARRTEWLPKAKTGT